MNSVKWPGSTEHVFPSQHPSPRLIGCLLICCLSPLTGCATIRVTDPPRTADEQFLVTTAASKAVAKLSMTALRDRKVWVDSAYFNAPEQPFVVGELRSRLLLGGVRLVPERKDAQIILEVRSGGVGINRKEFLLGLSSLPLLGLSGLGGSNNSSVAGSAASSLPLTTPELAIFKHTEQRGFATIAFVAYWIDTGEVVTSSGPFVGQTNRNDTWFFGFGPETNGNIPPTGEK